MAHLEGASLGGAKLEGANLRGVHLEGANLYQAQLQRADLGRAYINEALLAETQLEGADLRSTHLEGADLSKAQLEGVDLRGAIFDIQTDLTNIVLDAHIRVADVVWNNVPLMQIQWEHITWLGDEEQAHQLEEQFEDSYGRKWKKLKETRIEEYQAAIRANRQLAVTLRSQGMNEVADRFTYRAQVLQRELLWLEIGLPMPGFKHRLAWLKDQSPLTLWQKRKQLHLSRVWNGSGRWLRQQGQRGWKGLRALRPHRWSPHLLQRPLWQWALALIVGCLVIGVGVVHWWNALFAILLLTILVLGLRQQRGRKLLSYLFSLFLAVLTGYGYRMSRIVVAYLLLICGFATAYWSVGVNHPRDISFWTALIVSVTAFHGRVFTNPFAPNIPDAQVVITAIEAIVGLVIEGVFIAMLTQRFFNR